MYLKVKTSNRSNAWAVYEGASFAWDKGGSSVSISFMNPTGDITTVTTDNEAYLINDKGTTIERLI